MIFSKDRHILPKAALVYLWKGVYHEVLPPISKRSVSFCGEVFLHLECCNIGDFSYTKQQNAVDWDDSVPSVSIIFSMWLEKYCLGRLQLKLLAPRILIVRKTILYHKEGFRCRIFLGILWHTPLRFWFHVRILFCNT